MYNVTFADVPIIYSINRIPPIYHNDKDSITLIYLSEYSFLCNVEIATKSDVQNVFS